MVRRNLRQSFALAAALACVAASPLRASSEGPFVPPPIGSVVAREPVAFNGEDAANRWIAVLSKERVGFGNGRDFYQWHLSVYQLRRGGYRVRYESPGNGGPLSRVTQASNGAKIWFPTQAVSFAGVGTLMHAGVEQLVVQSHETGADCGGATVTVFAAKPGATVGPTVTVTNSCDLNASIVGTGALKLTGPYYAKNAPLCCPTKPNAVATLKYADGAWKETPNYFTLSPPR